MAGGRTKDLLGELQRLLVFGSGAAVILLGVAFAWSGYHVPASPDENRDAFVHHSFVMAIAANLIPVFFLFVASFLTLRKVNQIRAEEEQADLVKAVGDVVAGSIAHLRSLGSGQPPFAAFDKFGKVPWVQLLEGCTHLDIVVHYFDTWINTHEEQLRKLLDRGGRIRLVLPSYKNNALVESIKGRFPGMRSRSRSERGDERGRLRPAP